MKIYDVEVLGNLVRFELGAEAAVGRPNKIIHLRYEVRG